MRALTRKALQDLRDDRQAVLQGHTAPITAACSCADRSIVFTADAGDEPTLVAWCTATAQPLYTASQPQGYGVRCMDLSADGTRLVTISRPPEAGAAQHICLWDVAERGGATCLITVPVPAGDEQARASHETSLQRVSLLTFALYEAQRGMQTCVRFNGGDAGEVMSSGAARVFFWRACLPAAAAFQYYSPPLASADFRQRIGAFTCCAFVPGSPQALAGTVDGDVVVWDAQGVAAEVGTRAADRRAAKLMRLHGAAITLLATVGDFVVSGGADGFVRVFDPLLRLVAWFERAAAGAVRSVSFSRAPAAPHRGAAADVDAFLCPDFIVAGAAGRIVRLTAEAFNRGDTPAATGTTLVAGLPPDIAVCAAHPMQPLFLVMSAAGARQLWHLHDHVPVLDLPAPPAATADALRPTCAVYSRAGDLVAAGGADGALFILHAADLAVAARIKQSRSPVAAVALSAAGRHAAAATADGYVLLAALVPFKATHRWEFVGRTRVHYTPLVALHFGEAPSGETRCFSLSQDGRLVEYDLAKSSLEAGVVVAAQATLPHGAPPTAMAFAPPLSYYERGAIDTQLVIADAAHAVRTFDPDSAVTSATIRGPAFGGALAQLVMFQAPTSSGTLVAFRCVPDWSLCPGTYLDAAVAPLAGLQRSSDRGFHEQPKFALQGGGARGGRHDVAE